MAQWMRQFSGLTHGTKVQDVEASLRQALAALSGAAYSDRARKAKAVRRLCERLLASRLKELRARYSALTEPGKKSEAGKRVVRLLARQNELNSQGIDGILKEFGVPEDICR
jgi:hypothetical protein